MIRRPPRSTLDRSSAASDVYKRQVQQYYTASSFVPQGKPTKITAGAELNVLASISGDGKSIVLALNPRVNTDVQLVKYATLTDYQGGTNNPFSSFDINLPQYRTQELSTRVTVNSGDTVVMGLSLIHISEPTRLLSISYAVFC